VKLTMFTPGARSNDTQGWHVDLPIASSQQL
jgi:hypothetical protein